MEKPEIALFELLNLSPAEARNGCLEVLLGSEVPMKVRGLCKEQVQWERGLDLICR